MNLAGQKFGKLYVIEKTKEKNKSGDYKYRCICDCGNEILVVGWNLKNGHSKTCGCSRSTISKGYRNKNVRIYNIYQNMKQRCYDKNAKFYKNYGARGIIICKEWLGNYELFYNWAINNGYSNDLSIDRIDVNGNYEPSNCRWVTKEVQDNNRRTNKRITYKNETKTLSQWSKEYNINIVTLSDRLKSGMSFEEALNKPTIKGGGKLLFTINGETKLLSEWCQKYNVNYQTAWEKIKKGYDIKKALKLDNF